MSNKKWKEAVEKAKQHQMLSKPEYVIIVDILSYEKLDDNSITFNQLFDKIQNKIGDCLTERQVRYYLNNLIKNGYVNKKTDKNKNKVEYLLNNEFSIINTIPKIQLYILIASYVFSACILFYDIFAVMPYEYSFFAIIMIVFNTMILFTNNIDLNFTIKNYSKYFDSFRCVGLRNFVRNYVFKLKNK